MAAGLPLVVILGPTASGKSKLAIDLANEYSGEIICADSRTIYKGLDVGTAKPTKEDQNIVQHWGLDLVEPNDYFSVADFKNYALSVINDVRKRNHVPFLVGGSGLYIDSIIFDYQFGETADQLLRQNLQQKTITELQKYCQKNNVVIPENRNNKRYLVRAIENKRANPSRRDTPIRNTIIVGITTEKPELHSRIEARINWMLDNGVIEEAKDALKLSNPDKEAMKSNIYRLVHLYVDGQLSREELIDKAVTADLHLMKKQLTWFKRNTFIHWFSYCDAEKYISEQLAISKNP